MVKIKRVRTIDAVVVGWRPGKEEGTVGSLILGLYDDDGKLHVVGHSSGLRAAEKRDAGRRSSRRTRRASAATATPAAGRARRSSSGSRCGPELVVEVTFDHVSGGRIRHGTKILRWRDDKAPRTASSSRCRCSRAEPGRLEARLADHLEAEHPVGVDPEVRPAPGSSGGSMNCSHFVAVARHVDLEQRLAQAAPSGARTSTGTARPCTVTANSSRGRWVALTCGRARRCRARIASGDVPK